MSFSFETCDSAIRDIKLAILQARAKAAHLANAEALKLYFFVGGYVSKKTRNAKWGSGAIEALSERLQVELPGPRGFSASSIKRMRAFFEAWSDVLSIRPMPLDETGLTPIRPTSLGEYGEDAFMLFLSLGFSFHATILEKTQNVDERFYYVMRAAKEMWSHAFPSWLLEHPYKTFRTRECHRSHARERAVLSSHSQVFQSPPNNHQPFFSLPWKTHKSINPYYRWGCGFDIMPAMRMTLDIPDTMYRRIKMRTAQEGTTMRSVTLVLYSQWLGDESAIASRCSSVRKRKAPAWFGSVKVDANLPHDMMSIRKSIAHGHGE